MRALVDDNSGTAALGITEVHVGALAEDAVGGFDALSLVEELVAEVHDLRIWIHVGLPALFSTTMGCLIAVDSDDKLRVPA